MQRAQVELSDRQSSIMVGPSVTLIRCTPDPAIVTANQTVPCPCKSLLIRVNFGANVRPINSIKLPQVELTAQIKCVCIRRFNDRIMVVPPLAVGGKKVAKWKGVPAWRLTRRVGCPPHSQ